MNERIPQIDEHNALQKETADDPEWFRPPTPHEHFIAASLFVGFGVFFVLLYIVLNGWWFRWVIAGLAIISVLHGTRHAMLAVRQKGH